MHENAPVSLIKILFYRIKKAGVFKGISQFIFKIYDFFFLRNQIRKTGKQVPVYCRPQKIGSLNTIQVRNKIFSNKYDVVIAIATSILKPDILSVPNYGFINIHPGILPQYRGTGNLWAVTNCDIDNVGCSIHWMTTKIDKGNMISISYLKDKFYGLWEMNYLSLKLGVNDLSKIIIENRLLVSKVEINESDGNYYSWYGIEDYIRFKLALKKWRKNEF